MDVAHALAAVKGWRSAQIWPCQGSPVSITAADAKAQRDGAALLTLQLTGRGSLKLVDRRGSKPKKLKNVAAITVGRPPTSFELPVELR